MHEVKIGISVECHVRTNSLMINVLASTLIVFTCLCAFFINKLYNVCDPYSPF